VRLDGDVCVIDWDGRAYWRTEYVVAAVGAAIDPARATVRWQNLRLVDWAALAKSFDDTARETFLALAGRTHASFDEVVLRVVAEYGLIGHVVEVNPHHPFSRRNAPPRYTIWPLLPNREVGPLLSPLSPVPRTVATVMLTLRDDEDAKVAVSRRPRLNPPLVSALTELRVTMPGAYADVLQLLATYEGW
jgi:hypothetical protein